jgi:hypothetical protein
MKELPSPNMIAHPTIQKAMDEIPKTTKFLPKMLTAFLARQKPASTHPNPAFMKKTNIPAIKTHKVSTATSVVQTESPPLSAKAAIEVKDISVIRMKNLDSFFSRTDALFPVLRLQNSLI